MGLRYRVPLPGLFYYSGRVGPGHWLPRSSSTSSGLAGFTVKCIVYPSIVFSALVWLSWSPRSMVCSGWCAAGSRIVGSVGRSVSVSPVQRPFLAVLEVRVVSSVGLVSHPPSRGRMGRRMRPCVSPFIAPRLSWCSVLMGVMCLGQHTPTVADVTPRWGGQAAVRALELRPSGARRAPRNATQTIAEKEKRP